jgi:hypothetical protein
MSRITNTKNVPKPHCKVCFDAGKPESEYTSHWVRTLPDRSGKSTITCPTLLNTECRYCSQIGHTTKFCKVLEKYNKEREREEKVQKKEVKKTAKQPKPVAANAFASLCDSDTDEEEVSEYPTLKVVLPTVKQVLPTVKQQEVKTGWAAIVAKPAEIKKVVEPTKPTGLVMLSDYIKPVEEKKVMKPAPWAKSQSVVKKSWADESDSEDETEEYDFVPYVEEIDATW